MLPLILLIISMSGCVGLNPQNKTFGEDATEVIGRVALGIPTLGVSEIILTNTRKAERIEAEKKAAYQAWFNSLDENEKAIEELKQSQRMLLMGQVLQGRPVPQLSYTPSPHIVPPVQSYRQPLSCTSNQTGSMTNVTCY